MADETGGSFFDRLEASRKARNPVVPQSTVPSIAPPQYALDSLVAKPGEPIRVMGQDEVANLAASKANGPVPFDVTNTILKTDPTTRTAGVPKMVLPISRGWTTVTPQEFAQGNRPSMQQDFVVVPRVAPPDAYWKYNPVAWKDLVNDPAVNDMAKRIYEVNKDTDPFEGDNKEHYIKQAIQQLRINAINQHYGQGNIAFSFHNEGAPKEPDKVIPDRLPVGMPGVPALQFNAPIAPTIVGSLAAAIQSGQDAVIADRVFDFGQAMIGQNDEKQVNALADGAARAARSRRATQRVVGGEDPNVFGFGVHNDVNDIILKKYTKDQLMAMSPEARVEVGREAAREYLRQQAMDKLRSAFEVMKSKNEGISMFRTSDYYKPDFSLSKLTQQTATSFVPTAAPMLASMFGSMATGGPWGGKAASAAMTYKLSTDSQFLEDLSQWAGENGIDINQDPAVVMDQMVKMAEKDPKGFSQKLKGMVDHARVAGGLEAGVAFALNEGLEHVKIPGTKEGSVWQAARKMGQPGVVRGYLVPRALKLLEDTAKEAVEEYSTEVFVGFGKGVHEGMQKGDPFWEAANKQVKEIAASYLEDDPNVDKATNESRRQMAEQRNDAGMIGAYMSLMTRMITGKGNPDTALIRQARRGAAEAIAARSQRKTTIEEIERHLEDGEKRTFAQMHDLADELMTMSGNGRLADDVARRISPLTEQQMNDFPINGMIGGQDVLLPGQRATLFPEPIVSTVKPQGGDAEVASGLARAFAENKRQADADAARARDEAERRRALDEGTAEYRRQQDLELERYKAWESLRDANRNYANLLQEYGQDSQDPAFLEARKQLLEASEKYKALHPEQGK
jgi:hypothetical protein